MVVKCPYCGSVGVSTCYINQGLFNTDAQRIFEAKCHKCNEDFVININYDLIIRSISYFNDCNRFIKREMAE